MFLFPTSERMLILHHIDRPSHRASILINIYGTTPDNPIDDDADYGGYRTDPLRPVHKHDAGLGQYQVDSLQLERPETALDKAFGNGLTRMRTRKGLLRAKFVRTSRTGSLHVSGTEVSNIRLNQEQSKHSSFMSLC